MRTGLQYGEAIDCQGNPVDLLLDRRLAVSLALAVWAQEADAAGFVVAAGVRVVIR